jgi:hypothetical protein
MLLEYARNLTAYRASLVHFLDSLIGRHRDGTGWGSVQRPQHI